MFPHRFDRYRALGYIVRQLRKKTLAITQTQLADKSGVTQGTISHLENFTLLSNAADLNHKPVARDVFINTALHGLELSQPDVEALLWLMGGEEFEPLSGVKEAGPSATSHLREAESGQSSPASVHDRALNLLKRAVELGMSGKKITIRMLTGWDEKHQVTFRHELLRMEKKPGQRLLVSKFPSQLTLPQNIIERQGDYNKILSPNARERIVKLTEQRKKRFREVLREYGERCIHSTESIKRYLSKDLKHNLSLNDRRAHVRNLIELLKEYEHFKIALARAEPEMEFVIKCGWGASLRGTAREVASDHDAVICGPLYIFWDNKTTVYSFVVDFEHAWQKIPPECRNKENVISILEHLLR